MSNTTYIENIIDVIESNEKLVQYDYNNKKDQILLLKDLVDKLLVLVSKLKDINISPKSLLDLALRDAFELSKSDLILNKKGYILLKLIDESKIKEVAQKDKDTIANRYAGVDEEELKLFYDEFITDTSDKDFFLSIAQEFTEKYFNEENITNVAYEKYVFSYIQEITFNNLEALYDNSDGFFDGFAGYIFRIHFKEVFENIADIILDSLAMSNTYIVRFLNYYTSNVIVMNGHKYKVPHIETEDGLRWTLVSMLSVAKIYTKSIRSRKILKEEILTLNQSIKKLYIKDLSPLAYQIAYAKTKALIEDKTELNKKKYEELTRMLEVCKDDRKIKTIKIKIKDIKILMKELNREYEELLKKKIDKNIVKKYTNLQTIMDKKTRGLLRDENIIKQNKKQYLSMRESLVKALISKKKKV